MGPLQWIRSASVHSADRFQDYSRSLSIVYVSHDRCNVSRCHKNTDGGLNIDELAIHMAKYQAVLTELQVRVKMQKSQFAGLKVQRIARGVLRLSLQSEGLDTAGNPGGSGKNLSLLRGGGSETQGGK